MEVKFRRSVPVDSTVLLEAYARDFRDSEIRTKAQMFDREGRLYAEAEAIFKRKRWKASL